MLLDSPSSPISLISLHQAQLWRNFEHIFMPSETTPVLENWEWSLLRFLVSLTYSQMRPRLVVNLSRNVRDNFICQRHRPYLDTSYPWLAGSLERLLEWDWSKISFFITAIPEGIRTRFWFRWRAFFSGSQDLILNHGLWSYHHDWDTEDVIFPALKIIFISFKDKVKRTNLRTGCSKPMALSTQLRHLMGTLYFELKFSTCALHLKSAKENFSDMSSLVHIISGGSGVLPKWDPRPDRNILSVSLFALFTIPVFQGPFLGMTP